MPKKSKLKIRSILICEGVRNEVNGQQTLVGVFTGPISSQKVPLEIPAITFRIEYDVLENFKEEFSFTLMTPSRVRLFDTRNVIKAKKNMRGVLTINARSAVFNEAGTYNLRFGPIGNEKIIDKLVINFTSPK